ADRDECSRTRDVRRGAPGGIRTGFFRNVPGRPFRLLAGKRGVHCPDLLAICDALWRNVSSAGSLSGRTAAGTAHSSFREHGKRTGKDVCESEPGAVEGVANNP